MAVAGPVSKVVSVRHEPRPPGAIRRLSGLSANRSLADTMRGTLRRWRAVERRVTRERWKRLRGLSTRAWDGRFRPKALDEISPTGLPRSRSPRRGSGADSDARFFAAALPATHLEARSDDEPPDRFLP